MRDDVEFNIQFCETVEQYPQLYDYNRSDYCNRSVQDKAWELIAIKLNESVSDCKERWQNIRGRHGKMHKSQLLPSGSAAKKIKDYYLGPHLQFLNNFLKSRPPKGNIVVNASDTGDKNISDYDDDGESNSSHPKSTEAPSASPISDSMSPLPSSAISMNKNPPTLKDVHKSAYDFFMTKNKKLNKSTDSSDTDLCFLKSVLPDMTAMTAEQKRRFKIGILNLAGQILEENNTETTRAFTNYRSSGSESPFNRPYSAGSTASSADIQTARTIQQVQNSVNRANQNENVFIVSDLREPTTTASVRQEPNYFLRSQCSALNSIYPQSTQNTESANETETTRAFTNYRSSGSESPLNRPYSAKSTVSSTDIQTTSTVEQVQHSGNRANQDENVFIVSDSREPTTTASVRRKPNYFLRSQYSALNSVYPQSTQNTESANEIETTRASTSYRSSGRESPLNRPYSVGSIVSSADIQISTGTEQQAQSSCNTAKQDENVLIVSELRVPTTTATFQQEPNYFLLSQYSTLSSVSPQPTQNTESAPNSNDLDNMFV